MKTENRISTNQINQYQNVSQQVVSGTFTLDYASDIDVYFIELLNNTTIIESNIPSADKARTIVLHIRTDGIGLGLPSVWRFHQTGEIEVFANLNTIVVQKSASFTKVQISQSNL